MTTETINGYPVSRDYELLADLVLAGPVFCFLERSPSIISSGPSIFKGRTIYQSQQRAQIYATNKPDFIQQCAELNVAFVMPEITPQQQTAG